MNPNKAIEQQQQQKKTIKNARVVVVSQLVSLYGTCVAPNALGDTHISICIERKLECQVFLFCYCFLFDIYQLKMTS